MITVKEISKTSNSVTLHVRQNPDEREPRYQTDDEVIAMFGNGICQEVVINRVNGNNVKNGYGKFTPGSMSIEKDIMKELEEIVQYAKSQINEIFSFINENCIAESSRVKFNSTITVGDFFNFQDRLFKSMNSIIIEDSDADIRFPKCYGVVLKTHPKFSRLAEIKKDVALYKMAIDKKMTDAVLRSGDTQLFKLIRKMGLNRFLELDIDIMFDEVKFQKTLSIERGFIPITYLVKQDSKMVEEMIRSQVTEMGLMIHGFKSMEIHCDLESGSTLSGTVYINKPTNIEMVKKLGRNYFNFSQEITGMNFAIGEGTFNIKKLMPSIYTEHLDIEKPLIIHCSEQNLRSKKKDLNDCYTNFSLILSQMIAVPLKQSMGILHETEIEDFKAKAPAQPKKVA